jgi:hypothetical protein
MSHTATRPWWAEVEHLRPAEDDERTRPRRSGRFERRPGQPGGRRHPEPEVWLDSTEPERDKPKPERRTIEIRGQVDKALPPITSHGPGPQRHRTVRPSERVGPRPDRVALWAVLLGLLLILVAAISSPGASATFLAF